MAQKKDEIEKKWLIRCPDDKTLSTLNATPEYFVQTYLKTRADKIERRIRAKTSLVKTSYIYTKKWPSDNLIKRPESDRDISKLEYCLRLLLLGDKQLIKTRHCFWYKDQFFELDIYPDWTDDTAIMELELISETQKYEIPPQIEIIRDVTEDRAYKNAALAKKITKNFSGRLIQNIFAGIGF